MGRTSLSRVKLALGAVVLLLIGLVLWANMRDVKAAVVGETKTLDEDQYWYKEFALLAPAALRIKAALLQGPAVDLYLVDKRSYDGLQAVMAGTLPIKELEFDYFDRLSRAGLAGEFDSGWQEMHAGIYYVIVDHSVFGATVPPEVGVGVRFRVEVETKR